MKITMNITSINSIEEIKNFLQANNKIQFKVETRKDKYNYISEVLVKHKCKKARKKHRGIIKKYLSKVTGYESSQIKRLIKKWKQGKLLCELEKIGNNKNGFKRKYDPEDIALLIKTDVAHKTRCGRVTSEHLKRELFVFGKDEYANIANISQSHIYNIRKENSQYLTSEAIKYSKTNPVSTNIGERRKPQPDGKPGYLRVDSVHQGDKDGEKGVYHINTVDEVTQEEVVGCTEGISEYFLEGLLEDLIEQFPFKIINFHSDNGSEYINKVVAKLLNKLMAKQTKSRSRHCNDNALVECKNGAVIRKHIGRSHISKKNAPLINEFYKKYFNPYLNYHRVCEFATEYTDKNGKVRKKYDERFTPYDKLKSLDNAEQYLKDGITFEQLDEIAYAESDNEFAEKMQKEKIKMFKKIKN
jgi:hypothetical protein